MRTSGVLSILLLFCLTAWTQNQLGYWGRVELAAGTYFVVGEPDALGNFTLSPSVSGGVRYPLQPWAHLELGLAYTYTQQKHPAFRNHLQWLGVPIVIALWPWPDAERKIRPLLKTQFQPYWRVGASHQGASGYLLANYGDRFRGEWGMQPGVALQLGSQWYEVCLLASMSSAINEVLGFDVGANLPKLMGTRLGISVGTRW